jgi:peroxiredoxin
LATLPATPQHTNMGLISKMTTRMTTCLHHMKEPRPGRSRIGSLFSIFIFAVVLTANATSALNVGDRAPGFSAPSLDGKSMVELSEFRGKVVYLDFWASWCAPCLTAIPEIEKMRGEFSSEDFQIIAVNLDQKPKKALRFLEKHPVGYPSASDPKGKLPGLYGVETMPTSYLIDGDGVIRYVHRGFKRGDGSKLRDEIRMLLEARK